MSIFNRPRIVQFNPNSKDIIIGEENALPNINIPIRPTSESTSPLPMPVRSSANQDVIDSEQDARYSRSRMSELYQPETTNIDRMNRMIEGMPVRKEPGKMRAIFGAIAQGLGGGPQANENIRYAGYNREMDDWNARLKPVESAAGIERQNNANMRSVASSIVSQESAEARIARQIERDRVLREQGERRLGQGDRTADQRDRALDQANERIRISEEVAKGGQFEVDDAGNARIVRKDGSTLPVDMSYMSFSEKQKLKDDAALERVRERVKADPKLAIRIDEDPNTGERVYSVINLNTNTAVDVDDKTPAPDPNNPRTPVTAPKVNQSETDKAQGIVNRAAALKNSRSDWSKYITIKGNQVTITKPSILGGGWTTPTKEVYDEISKAIYGEVPKEAPVKGKTGDVKVNQNVTPSGKTFTDSKGNKIDTSKYPKQAGKTLVLNANDQVGYVPTNQVSQLPKGWKVIE